jgi:hypothetical protein
MMTFPAYGARYFRQIGASSRWVVKIVKGSSTWLFSDTDMQLTDGHVYALLTAEPSIESAVDYVTKEWSVQDVRLNLANTPYKQNASHAWVSFADETDVIRGATLSIYVLAGVSPTALSDGLLIFSGEISEPATVTLDEVQLYAIDGARRRDALLPQNLIIDTGGAASPYSLRKSPLVWGEYNKTYDSSVDLGLVLCEPLYNADGNYYLIADHVCHTVTSAFYSQPQLPHPSKIYSPTLTADDSGRCTTNIANTGGSYGQVHADAYLFVDGQNRGAQTDGAGYDGQCVTVNAQKAGDLDTTSYATVTDAITGSGVHAHAYFSWPDYDRTDNAYTNEIGLIGGVAPGTAYNLNLEWDVTLPDITGTAYIKLLGLSGTPPSATITGGTPGSLAFAKTTTHWDDYVYWHPRAGLNTSYGTNYPVVAVVYMDTTKTPTTAGREVFYVKYIRLVIRYIPSAGFQYLTVRAIPQPRPGSRHPNAIQRPLAPKPTYAIYAAVKGRKFGAWIDEGGRSNSYNENNLIEDPAFIVESILRDELGFVSADIDTASFDAAANPNVKARLHLNSDNQDYSYAIIRQLAEQSTFAFTVSGVSHPRLIDLDIDSPTVARTLNASDIDMSSLVISKESKLVNDLKIEHHFMEEYGGSQSFSQYSNATSMTDFGTFTQEFNWPNITGDSVNSVYEVADLIRRLWAAQHTTISFTCPGVRNCDLEVGDWVLFDPTTIDPLVLCYGASWANTGFLISNIRHTPTSTFITAVNLNVAPAGNNNTIIESASINLAFPDVRLTKNL